MPKPSVISTWRIEIFIAASLFHPAMLLTATFHGLALSTSFSPDLESSSLSLNWVLSSDIASSASLACGLLSLPCGDGSFRSMNVKLVVVSSLPSDLVLGRDWTSYGLCYFPNAHFVLDSGYVHIHLLSTSIFPVSILSRFLLYMSSDLH
ncbi:hypothetical protein B0H14DRAFT_2996452 [Mycena olivaceomarginata]|nr:hypothetical protein B0H14DRAFT_2996452 [Mycena olivaceomarginata]